MKISKISVKNYRLLRDFSIDLGDDLSLIIGKNNCGKSSLLTILDKCLSQRKDSNDPRFSFNDFNIGALDDFAKHFSNKTINENNLLSIDLQITIEYTDKDNLNNVSRFMTNLDPSNNRVVILIRYTFDLQKLKSLEEEFKTYTSIESRKNKTIVEYLSKYYANYFIVVKYSIDTDDSLNTIKIKPEDKIEELINFSYIHAKRDIIEAPNKQSDRHIGTLSKLSAQYFNKESKIPGNSGAFDLLSQTIEKTDETLTTSIYPEIFKDLLKRTEDFGVKDESKIDVISAINEARILSDNTIVTHRQLNHLLPEDYNGLGYLNLFTIIFQIEVAIKEFAKAYAPHKNKADINLLFIEEPEAHTHPQLQYIFIRNIKNMLKKSYTDSGIALQTLISTHSSHIVAASDFSDVKYFYRESQTSVIAKNLSALKKEYAEEPKQYDFLRQYLKLTSGELFFADKAVLIEGDTERLLLPTMMRKIDLENKTSDILPLLSQNISVVEVGAYTQVFERFINFLGIKTLIITDIDTNDDGGEACPVSSAKGTSNGALNLYFSGKTIDQLKKLSFDNRILNKVGDSWENDKTGRLCVSYQSEEKGKNNKNNTGRSFEEAFIHINFDFVNNNKDKMRGLKNRDYFNDSNKTIYDLSKDCICKKTYFALDIIYFSDDNMSNWKIPKYIKDGLLWLQQK